MVTILCVILSRIQRGLSGPFSQRGYSKFGDSTRRANGDGKTLTIETKYGGVNSRLVDIDQPIFFFPIILTDH